jgi:hypothetical protein
VTGAAAGAAAFAGIAIDAVRGRPALPFLDRSIVHTPDRVQLRPMMPYVSAATYVSRENGPIHCESPSCTRLRQALPRTGTIAQQQGSGIKRAGDGP